MTIVPIKYKPADKYEERSFNAMVLLIIISVAAMVFGLALDALGVSYASFFLLYGTLSADLLLIGWGLANLLAHVELQKEAKA